MAASCASRPPLRAGLYEGQLKGFTRIGFRMIRRVIVVATGEELSDQQAAALSAGDLLRADLATLSRGIDRLTAESGGEKQLSLIVPISYSSLSSQRGRAELIAPVKEAGSLVKLGVICEILDIEGVPAGAVQAAATLVRPFSLLGRGAGLATPTASSIARLNGAGLQALSFECPSNLGEAEFNGWAQAVIRPAPQGGPLGARLWRELAPARGRPWPPSGPAT